MRDYCYKLSVCAIFRNEGKYLKEWLDFHISQGVEHFFLINDNSEDNYLDVLDPFLKSEIVTLSDSVIWDQHVEYNRALKKFGGRTKWMAFIDIDEFLFSPNGKKIAPVLDGLEDFSSVRVRWKVYGSSGLVEEPDGVVDNFLECARLPSGEDEKRAQIELFSSLRGEGGLTGSPFNVKSIIQPAKTLRMGIHSPIKEIGKSFKDENFELLRINHYWSRSLSHLNKKSRRDPANKSSRENLTRPGTVSMEWESHLNDTFDPIAARLINPHELPFVIFLGFNKTATRSIHRLMQENGFPAVHWEGNQLGKQILTNRSKGDRLLRGFEDRRSFTDLNYVSDSFFFEPNSLFREFKRDYPDAFFVLNNRDTEKWIESRMKHGGGLFAKRHKRIRGLETDTQLAEEWRAEKQKHESLVREFFKKDTHFLEFDIGDKTFCKQLGKFLEIDLDCSKLQKIGERPGESLA